MAKLIKNMSEKELRDCVIDAQTSFDIIEKMIQDCAASAVRETRLAWKYEKILSRKININKELINKIITCYQKSNFGAGLCSRYIKRVKDEFLSIVYSELVRSCHNQAHYDLILPIIFFRCIMQNEFNPESVQSRLSDLEADWHARNIDNEVSQEELSCCDDPCERDAEWENRKYKWIKSYDSGKVLSAHLYQLDTRSQEFHNIVSSAEKKARDSNFKTNESIPLQVRIACEGFFHLKDQYEDVKKCSEYARIGCFLYDLLKETGDNRKSMDTILRLYMVSEIHDVLNHTRKIIRGFGYAIDDEMPSLLHQFTAEDTSLTSKDEVQQSGYIACWSDETFSKTIALAKTTRAKKDMFLAFYDHLSEGYVIKNTDILEFYLDKTILEPCIGLDKTIENYARAVKRLVAALPSLEHTVTHAETAIRMTKLFREDQVQEAWENSDDYAVRQEVKKIFGI